MEGVDEEEEQLVLVALFSPVAEVPLCREPVLLVEFTTLKEGVGEITIQQKEIHQRLYIM